MASEQVHLFHPFLLDRYVQDDGCSHSDYEGHRTELLQKRQDSPDHVAKRHLKKGFLFLHSETTHSIDSETLVTFENVSPKDSPFLDQMMRRVGT
mmetsp:Transcript_40237/g.97197  ORF Transcript_40237/g.97197 Transcript_40237/m.97197 type:complete len:95 (+) Transcript_40237:426-710(+)